MRILHLETDDGSGGATRANYRLHQGLVQLGVDSQLLVLTKYTSDPTVSAFVPPGGVLGRVRRRWRRELIARRFAPYRARCLRSTGTFADCRTETAGDLLPQLPPADLIHLHWLVGFFDWTAVLPRLPAVPLAWTPQDMSTMTGGCHVNGPCQRFTAACGICPELGSTDPQDLSARVLAEKQQALAAIPSERLRLVPVSTWFGAQMAASSLLQRFPRTLIPSSVNTDVFCPQDRAAARAALGLAPDALVLFFSASWIGLRLKGFPDLLHVLPGLVARWPKLMLLTAGKGLPPMPPEIPHLHLGMLHDDARLAQAYNAADLFINPTYQDSFGLTVIEALACGTPVVGYATGGLLDTVRPGETGARVPAGDLPALSAAIDALLAAPAERLRLSALGRAIAVREYAMPVHARRYLALYEELLAARM